MTDNPFTGTTTYSTSSQMRQEQMFSSAQTSSSGTYNHGNVSDITSSNLHQCNATFSGHQHFPFPPAEALSPPLSSASSCKSTATPSLASSRRRRGPSVRSDDSDRIPRIYLYGGDDHMAYNDMHGQPSSRSMKMPDYLYLGWRKKKLEKDPKKEYHWARPIKKLK